MIRVTVLGSGTSHGVPAIGCDCAVCRSSDPRDRRTRPSILLEARSEPVSPFAGAVRSILVDTSTDLRQATVFVSVLGEESERSDALAGLRSSAGFLQAQIGRELRMKRTPTLDFVYDESVDTGMRISKLLAEEEPSEPGK